MKIKQFFKRLFCQHKFKYTGMRMDNRGCHWFFECEKCGKIKVNSDNT